MERKSLIKDREKEKLIFVSEDGVTEIWAIALLAKGGTSLAYKGIKRVNDTIHEYCIIKEYYPEDTNSDMIYLRQNEGEPLRIVVNRKVDEIKRIELIRNEQIKARNSLQRECNMIHKMYLNGENNSPYMENAYLIPECWYNKEDSLLSDSYYLILDTKEGRTLHAFLKENNGKLSFELSLSYIEKLLVIVETLLGNKYYHGDIKPSNIWLRGEGANQQVLLLDFGSAFDYAEFGNLENISDEQVIEVANSICSASGIGSSTEGYQSSKIIAFRNAKRNYIGSIGDGLIRRKKFAIALVNAMKELSVSSDIYSVVCILFQMIFGKQYIRDGSLGEVIKESGLSKVVIDYILEIMERNNNLYYDSVDKLRENIDILKILYNEGAHPKVLLDKLRFELEKADNLEIDTLLLADVYE